MQVDLFRRIVAGIFVMTMGVVAALPYHRTPPPLQSRPKAMQAFLARQSTTAEAGFGRATVTTSDAPSEGARSNFTEPTETAPLTTPLAGSPESVSAEVAPLLAEQRRPQRTTVAPGRSAAPTLRAAAVAEPRPASAAPTLRVAASDREAGVPDPLPAAKPIVESSLGTASPLPSSGTTPTPPPMASQFPSVLSPNAALPMAPVRRAPTTARSSAGGQAMSPAPATSPPARRGASAEARPSASLRTYIIRDGDTLSNIAARTLGSASRAGEIYQLNQSRLPSPQVLPLGVKIRIPPREPPRPGPDGMVPVYLDIGT